ncbi:MAG TPA: DUF411 domain-containing protein [Hyphomicrobiaceae bacterium]|jgi:hypothetical protein
MLRSLMLALVVMLGAAPLAAEMPEALMYKNPQCGCCEEYATYLRRNGFKVTVKETHNMSLISQQNGVPEKLAGCHTMLVGGYVVEGHVPVGAINRLLKERPHIKGIALPGMPEGSPGMIGVKTGPFTIYEISDEAKVFMEE